MITLNPQGIPAELKERPQWVPWLGTKPNGQPTRMPVRIGGGGAKTNDPSTWSTFDEALAAFNRGGYAGIGYIFSEDDPFAGVDLDGCRDPETGAIAEWAQKVVDRLDSYTEVSPSGSGLKIFVRGKSPFDTGKNQKLPQHGSIGGKNAGIEIYDQRRFFTVTGQVLLGRNSK